MSHTPGPWEKEYIADDIVIARKTDTNVVCYIPRKSVNAEDNARLVVALPDLLEALALIANGNESDWGYDHPENKIVAFCRAVIAQAKGEIKD